MALVSDLIVKLTLDNKAFNSTLSSTHSELEKLKDSFKEKFIEIASIATIAAGFHKLAEVLHETTEEVSKLVDVSTGLNITAEALEKLRWVGAQNSIATDEMDSSLNKLQKTLVENTATSELAAASVGGLALTYNDLIGLSLDQQFNKIAAAMKEQLDPAEQARTAYELFGKNGSKMLTALRDDVKGLSEEWETLGAGISGKQAAAIEKYGDSVAKMQKVFEAFGMQLTASLAPTLTILAEAVTALITAWGGLGEIGKSVGNVLITNMMFLTNVIITTVKTIDALKIGYYEFLDIGTKVATLGISNLTNIHDILEAKKKEAQLSYDDPALGKYYLKLEAQAIELQRTGENIDKITKKKDVEIDYYNTVAQKQADAKQAHELEIQKLKEVENATKNAMKAQKEHASFIDSVIKSSAKDVTRAAIGAASDNSQAAATPVNTKKFTMGADKTLETLASKMNAFDASYAFQDMLDLFRDGIKAQLEPKKVEVKIQVDAAKDFVVKVATSEQNKAQITQTVTEVFNNAVSALSGT